MVWRRCRVREPAFRRDGRDEVAKLHQNAELARGWSCPPYGLFHTRSLARPTNLGQLRPFFCVDERQISLDLDTGFTAAPVVVSELRDEIAAAWGLPLGQRVEVCFRGGERSAVTGVLELLRAPDYPWDPHQALKLGIAGFVFSSREIERWTKT